MPIPPIPTFDIDSLEPFTVETTLQLPRLSNEDVRAATHTFSVAVANISECDAHRDPKLFAELFVRCLLMVSYELIETPEAILAQFRDERFDPWLEHRCKVLVPSARGAGENRRAVAEFLSSWSAGPVSLSTLKTSAVLIAVGSLVAIGRLPVQEAPEPMQMN